MNNNDLGDALRPRVPAACRAWLESASDGPAERVGDHLDGCSSCREHFAAARVLGSLIATRPVAPTELLSRATLEGVFDRAIAAMEATSLASALPEAMQVASPTAVADTPPGLLASSLAQALSVGPPRQSFLTWTTMRESILAGAVAGGRRHGAPVRRVVAALVVAAASVAISLMMIRGNRAEPSISFIDLDSMPTVEFAIVRHGVVR